MNENQGHFDRLAYNQGFGPQLTTRDTVLKFNKFKGIYFSFAILSATYGNFHPRDRALFSRYAGPMPARSAPIPLARQLLAFGGVGVVAVIFHYAVLIGLREGFCWAPVPATLLGYVAGGFVSYILNRRHTFDSDASHGRAGPRFVLVAAVGFAITWGLMHLATQMFSLPYLLAQCVITGIVMVWSYGAHRYWTFGTT